MNIFTERFNDLVRRHNFTHTEVAEATGLSAGAISRMCAGYTIPNVDTILIIARFFNVTTDYLFGHSIHENRDAPYGGLYYNNALQKWKACVPSEGRPRVLGYYDTKGLAIAAIKEYQYANAQHQDYVRPGRWNGNGGPGPGQCGPSDSDMGKRLQRDEGFIPGGEKALPRNS